MIVFNERKPGRGIFISTTITVVLRSEKIYEKV